MKKKDLLERYRKKRDFGETPEPSDKAKASRKSKSKDPMFVIQKHDATRLHYDFRIEAEGVLKSWAVPKGPSTNPIDKRLAMPTEDHPMAYGRFEGRIPEGNYGAGPVIVWDIGTYRNLSDIPVEEALRKGHVKIWLEGKKVKGGYALTRISRSPARWLLVKLKDEKADPARDITKTDPNSVLSGKSVDDIAA
jgi:DNA ligase D-like protein (predicted 3'-phosphoesterase)